MNVSNDEQSIFLRRSTFRRDPFKRNTNLEALLRELSGYLGPIEEEIEREFSAPSQPPIFIVGNPRSGTSLFTQFLSRMGTFSVPTNLLARFYYAPFIGAKIQQLLTNPVFDYKEEVIPIVSHKLESDIGNSKGQLAPNEFYHFWRRFLPRYDPQYLSPDDLNKVDLKGLSQGIAAIEYVFDKPFASKAIMLQYNLDVLIKGFANSLVVYIRREPLFVMQSILQARRRYYGSENFWWSVKPQEYDQIKDLDVHHQIAGQVYYTEQSLKQQLEKVPRNHKLILDYCKLCSSPEYVVSSIVEKYRSLGTTIEPEQVDSSELICRNEIRIDKMDIAQLERAYQYFSANEV